MLEEQIEKLTKLIMTIETYAVEETFMFSMMVTGVLWFMVCIYVCVYVSALDEEMDIISTVMFIVGVFILFPIYFVFDVVLSMNLSGVDD